MAQVDVGIHRATPTLHIVDPRGLQVRVVEFYRADSALPAQPRVTQQRHDVLQRSTSSLDPRLFALAQAGAGEQVNQQQVYSLSGRVLSQASTDAGWHVHLYDQAGQLSRSWDSRGTRIWREYDALSRPVAQHEQQAEDSMPRCTERLTYAGPEAVTANLCGQLSQHDDGAGRLLITQASIGGNIMRHSRRFLADPETPPDWQESTADALLEAKPFVSQARFSALGELLEHIDTEGHCRCYHYDLAGQLDRSQVQLAGQQQPLPVLLDASYGAQGQLERQLTGNGVWTCLEYDPRDGRLLQMTARRDQQTVPLQDLHYAYDRVGNVLQMLDTAQPVRYYRNRRVDPVGSYRYDSLYQLVEASGREVAAERQAKHVTPQRAADNQQMTPYTQTYEYDASGNLLQMQHAGAQPRRLRMAVHSRSNRSLKVYEEALLGDGDIDSGFDGNGNMRYLQPGQSLYWDGANQLRQINPVVRAEQADDCEYYHYDGTGQRCLKWRRTKADGLYQYAQVRYLPGIEVRTNSANEELHVITLTTATGSARVLHWKSTPPAGIGNSRLRFGLSDQLGSCTLELDDKGQVLSHEQYFPFGGTSWWAQSHPDEAKYKTIRYSGKECDASGLYYYGYRYYAPWLQRWINPDPAGDVDGLNLFIMVRNNPLTLKDHAGLQADPATLDWLDLAPPPDPGKLLAAKMRPLQTAYTKFSGETESYKTRMESSSALYNKAKNNKARDAVKSSPDFISSNMLKAYSAHAAVSAADGESYASGYVNLPGSLSPKSLFPGVALIEPQQSPALIGISVKPTSAIGQRALREITTTPLASYKVTDITKFMAGVGAAYDSAGQVLHELVWRNIKTYIEENDYILPQSAGIAGLHAEVQAFNSWAWQQASEMGAFNDGGPKERMNTATFRAMMTANIFTKRVNGNTLGGFGDDFPACANCTGILARPINVMTGITAKRHVHSRRGSIST